MVEITTQTYLTFFTQNKTQTQHLNFHKCSMEQLRAHTCVYQHMHICSIKPT